MATNSYAICYGGVIIPAVVFTMENEFNELLVEERRSEPGERPKLCFPGVSMYQYEPHFHALPRGLRFGLGVSLVHAMQLYPQQFAEVIEENMALWYVDPDGNEYTAFAFVIRKWIGDVLDRRPDNHLPLRWVSIRDAIEDGDHFTSLMAQVIGKAK